MRKLKVIGLSALAVLAVSAVSASAAQAAEGTAVVSAGTTAYTATQVGGGHTFTLVGGRVLSCSTATFSGNITNGAKTVTATPNYAGCNVKVGGSTLPATVNTGTCTYTFSDLTTTAANTYAASTALGCASGDVTIKVYSNEANHTAGTRLCEYTIEPQTGLAGVHFTDNGNGTINITASSVAVETKRVFGTNTNCGEAAFKSTYNGDTLATAANGTLGIDD